LSLACCGRYSILIAVFALCLLKPDSSLAQELAPRSYWPAPKGTNLLVFGYQYSTGDVVTDPTLPIEGVDSKTHFAQLTYQRTLGLFGRSANIQFNLPYVNGTTEGVVEGEYRQRDISAMSDARILLSINLKGAPSMDRQAFQQLRAKPRTIIGASILIQPPTGAYQPDKFINAGTNRWAAKLGLGLILPLQPKWLLEVDVGTWFFGDNEEFVGSTRQQAPIASAEFHLVKRIRPGFWASLDVNYYRGGRTTVDGQERDDQLRNSRLGGTLVVPFMGHHAIRASYSTGLATNTGGDFNSFSVNYVYLW